jgi:hypothetical protein
LIDYYFTGVIGRYTVSVDNFVFSKWHLRRIIEKPAPINLDCHLMPETTGYANVNNKGIAE